MSVVKSKVEIENQEIRSFNGSNLIDKVNLSLILLGFFVRTLVELVHLDKMT